jgi:hypothetical protein
MRIPIKSVFFLFYFTIIICSAHLFLSKANANANENEKTTLDCLYCKPENYKMFRFVDFRHHKGLQSTHESVCQLIKDGKWDRDTANEFIYTFIFRLGACRGTNVNPDYEKFLKKDQGMPDSVLLAHRQFCKETFDYTYQWNGEDYSRLVEKIDWLEVEIFCQITHEMAYSSTFWGVLLEPDLPCIKVYQKRSDSICQKLRNGDITYKEAVYRWQQADLELDKRLGPEMVKKTGRDLIKPIENLIDMFTKIYSK